MKSPVNQHVSGLHRVIVGTCSALILILAIGSLFMNGGITEDPETHVPLDPRGAMIAIPVALGGLAFSLAGLVTRRGRRANEYRPSSLSHRNMPRVDSVRRQNPTPTAQTRAPQAERRVFWNSSPPRDGSNGRKSD